MEEVYAVKVRAEPDAARLYPSERRYSASTVGGLGAVHLALAATCILLAALDMGQPTSEAAPKWTARYGGGAWLGVAAAMAGLTGVLAWRRWYIDNNIRWFFICSCVSGIAAILCLAITSAAIATTHEELSARRLRAYSALKELELRHADADASDLTPLSFHLSKDTSEIPQDVAFGHKEHPERSRNDLQIQESSSESAVEDQPSHILHIPQNPVTAGLPVSHGGNREGSSMFKDLETDHRTEIHHVSSRQVISEDQFVEEGSDRPMKDEGHSVLDGDGEKTGRDEDVFDKRGEGFVDEGDSKSPRIILEHYWYPEGREMRFVVAVNILVASVLEIAWSVLSIKIAWKGMKNGYPDESPRKVDDQETGNQQDEKKKGTAKKNTKLRKPDIISNHDKTDSRRKAGKGTENRDPRLPLEESSMEYQERVRRFLASNTGD